MKLIISVKKIYSNIVKQGKTILRANSTGNFGIKFGAQTQHEILQPIFRPEFHFFFSPNSRSVVVTSRDYIDSKSAMEVAIDELFSIASVDWPPDEIYQVVMEIVTHLKNKIDAGRRKRKISESQSVDSSRR